MTAVEPAELADDFGVDPVLIEQIDDRRHREHCGWHARDGQRQVEDPAEERAAAGLPQRRRQVVALALVMHHVRGPEHRALVTESMIPVIAKIVKDDGQRPRPPRVWPGAERHVLEDERVDAIVEHPHEESDHLAHHAEAQAVDCVIQPVRPGHAARARHQQFQRDQQEKYRSGECDGLAHAAILALDVPAARALHGLRPTSQPNARFVT